MASLHKSRPGGDLCILLLFHEHDSLGHLKRDFSAINHPPRLAGVAAHVKWQRVIQAGFITRPIRAALINEQLPILIALIVRVETLKSEVTGVPALLA